VLVRPVNGTISVRADRVPVRLSLVEAIPRALRDVWILNAMTLGALWDILRGRVVRRSPARRHRAAGQRRGEARDGGLRTILANISVALAVFNFLPVPALDGGRLVFLGVELITGRKVNQRFESVVHVIGLLLLLALLVSVVLFSDLQLGRRLFSRGG